MNYKCRIHSWEGVLTECPHCEKGMIENARKTLEISKEFFGTDRTIKAHRLSADYNPPKTTFSDRLKRAWNAFREA